MATASDNDNSLGYTTGDDPGLVHRRCIGAGGYGEVHEVSSLAEEVLTGP